MRRVGAALRAIRIRRRLRQQDVAAKARVSRRLVGEVERGSETLSLVELEAIAEVLGARLDLSVHWHGADLSRLLSARHSTMHEHIARAFARHEGWTAEPEVSFSIFGERGVIDILAWHPERRSVLVVELKTELAEVQLLMSKMDQRTRLAVRSKFPADGRAVRRWLRDPVGTIAALSFLPDVQPRAHKAGIPTARRVRQRPEAGDRRAP